MRIEKNAGQIQGTVNGAAVEYLARGAVYTIALTSRGMQLQSRAGLGDLTVNFTGAREKSLEPLDPLPLRVNYYRGSDPSRYVTNAAAWSRLAYREIYPGIDLVVHPDSKPDAQDWEDAEDWEYDFSLTPGADPARIAFEIQGSKNLRLDANGDLVATATDGAVVRWRKPVSYSGTQGVESAFVLHGNRVSFRLGEWDHRRGLVIDPALVYSIYFGGSMREGARGVAIDPSGNVYIAGGSNSGDLPTTKSSYQPANAGSSIDNFGDAFIARFNSAGNLTYVTYFGGSGDDEATSIAVDSSGSVYIAGATNSTDLPRLNPAQANFGGSGTSAGNQWWGGIGDAFAAKFNSSGGLVYSTYLGGNQDDAATGIAVDSTGAAYIVGATNSTGLFASTPGYRKTYGGSPNQFINDNGYPTINLGDAFVLKLSSTGSQVLGFTYLGGAMDEAATTVTLDSKNEVWVGGCTNSTNFPTQNPFQANNGGLSPGSLQPFANCGDGFVSELSSDLSTLAYSTYFGGNGDDAISSIYVDSTGTVYLAGLTLSTNFPLKNPIQSTYKGPTTLGTMDGTYGDAFVARLNPATNTLMFSTYLGGSANDAASSMLVDNTGAVFIAGTTQSTDFPLQGALQTTMKGTSGMENTGDAFVAKMDPVAGKLLYSSYLGGARAEGAMGLALDSAGNLIVAGMTESTDFPVAATAQTAGGQTAPAGSNAFLTKISGLTTGAYLGGVGNVASYANTAVAPGEVIVLFGSNMGPATLTSVTALDPSTGLIPTTLAGAQVLFDGVAVPMVYVSATQSCAVAPYDLTGKTSTQIQVSYNGSMSPAITMPVAAAVPGLFSANSSGTGQGAIYNQDNTANSASNPAAQGSVITFFGTGQGVLSPAVPDGTLVTGTLPNPAAPVTVTFDGIPAASIAYKGPIPDLVVGFWQIDATLPALSSGTHQLAVTVGGVASQSNLTIAVK